jgi:hypothetical protein
VAARENLEFNPNAFLAMIGEGRKTLAVPLFSISQETVAEPRVK